MCNPASLLDLPVADLIQLQHNCLLELLRRYPPTWPTAPAYNLVRRIFDTTKELHQALENIDQPGQPTRPDLPHRLTLAEAVSHEQPPTP